jgi:hypothetical protein
MEGLTVIVAELDVLPSVWEVAVSVIGICAVAVGGAVNVMFTPFMLEVAEIVPHVVAGFAKVEQAVAP